MYLSGFYPGVYGINFDIHNIILIAYRILIIIDVYYSYKDIKSNKKYPGLIWHLLITTDNIHNHLFFLNPWKNDFINLYLSWYKVNNPIFFDWTSLS